LTEKTMILKEVYEITEEAIKRKEELKQQWASEEEINVVISEALFKIDVIVNWIPYHLMR
jgi:hypothetical protein